MNRGAVRLVGLPARSVGCELDAAGVTWAAPPTAAVQLWRELAGEPSALGPGSRTAVRRSRGISPPGWIGTVRLGDAFVVEVAAAPDDLAATLLACDDPTDPAEVAVALSPVETLGPGVLAYLPDGTPPTPDAALPSAVTVAVEPVDALGEWLGSLPPDEVAESDVAEMSEAVVARSDGQPVAAAGHHVWPTGVAHLGVVTDPAHRGRGLGAVVSRGAVHRAMELGLTPQWRAAQTNAGSRAVARRLGFVEVGRQFSIRLA